MRETPRSAFDRKILANPMRARLRLSLLSALGVFIAYFPVMLMVHGGIDLVAVLAPSAMALVFAVYWNIYVHRLTRG
jgi:hypothetical protein